MNKRKTGTAYEKKAAAYLKEKGYHILKRNYRCPLGEIDLIAEENGYLVFIEVKYRRTCCRFDVVAVNGTELTVIQNAFDGT